MVGKINKSKKVWMTAAEIPENTLFMMSEPTKYFIHDWGRLGLGDKLTEYFSYFVGDFTQMKFVRREFDAQAEFLSAKMIRQPRWTLRLIQKVEDWSRDFMRESKTILRSPLRDMTDRELVRLFKNCWPYHRQSHGVGASISWQADAEKERVTKGIWNKLEKHLHTIDTKHELADIFSILTTPQQESHSALEEKDFLRLAVRIKQNSKEKRIFTASRIRNIPEKVKQTNKKLHQAILRHHKKYCWLAYQYKGPATPLSEYIGRWQALLKQKSDPQKMLDKIIRDRRNVLSQQKKLIAGLEFDSYLRDVITMAQRLVFIKDFRKFALYHAMYCYEPLFIEVGRRLGLTINQMWAMSTWEIPDALLKGKYDTDELNERLKLAVAYVDRTKYVIYTGQEVKQFLKKVTMEKQSQKKARELRGTPACSGHVTGRVKIINVPSQMKKMKSGDIMVAHNTNPNLVPAMKKAAALVSEAGGLTCHTAIVARELRIPSVVGVPGADKVLKDGDKVEVDAGKGIIRKVK